MPPSRSALRQLAVIRVSDSFVVSGAAGTADCEILLTGAEWGSIVRIHADGTVDTHQGRVPGARMDARLETGGSRGVLVWSQEPPFLGTVSVADLSVDSVILPLHPWGDRAAGPVAPLPGDIYAMVPLGAGSPRRQPDPWIPAPLVQGVRPHGGVVWLAGHLREKTGHYLSWLSSRAAIGNVADTVLILTLSDAVLSAYGRTDAADTISELWARQLPIYFRAPEPREEAWTPQWIQQGGDVVHLIEVPHVSSAVFARNGTLYAVRTYAARWRRAANRFVPTQGNWEALDRGLEIYDANGVLLGAYALPTPTVNWLRIDDNGRLLLHDAAGSVLVAADPAFKGNSCPPLPPLIAVTLSDAPPPVRTYADRAAQK